MLNEYIKDKHFLAGVTLGTLPVSITGILLSLTKFYSDDKNFYLATVLLILISFAIPFLTKKYGTKYFT